MRNSTSSSPWWLTLPSTTCSIGKSSAFHNWSTYSSQKPHHLLFCCDPKLVTVTILPKGSGEVSCRLQSQEFENVTLAKITFEELPLVYWGRLLFIRELFHLLNLMQMHAISKLLFFVWRSHVEILNPDLISRKRCFLKRPVYGALWGFESFCN